MVALDIDALRLVASGDLGGAREHMEKMAEKQRERNIREWIKDNVNLTIYDHDPLTPQNAAELLTAVKEDISKEEQFTDPVELLKDKLYEYFWDVYSDWEIEASREGAQNLSETFDMPFDEALEWIQDNAIVSFPIDEYLNDTYKTVVMLDTGDSNADFTLNQVEPAYDGIPIEDISDEASLVWLAEQNGYSKEEFIHLMKNIDEIPEGEHPFIRSLYQEIENTSSWMNGVAFIGEMSLADLAKAQKEGVTVPKRTPCGLYDGWNGAGGLLDVKLQKDIVIPRKIIFSVLPDCCHSLRYEVDETFGFTNRKWETPLFAGVAKQFEPEEMEKAQKLFYEVYSDSAKGRDRCCLSPGQEMERLFAIYFRNSLAAAEEYPVYKGMLNRGQFTKAAVKALDNVESSTRMDSREDYRFSERHFFNLLEITPTKIPDEIIDSRRKHFEMLQRWKLER